MHNECSFFYLIIIVIINAT